MTAVAPEQTADLAVEATDTEQDDNLVLADLLVEEISIDGMCGVY
jgi:mycofactocin precursor